jgi:hypothetical protein
MVAQTPEGSILGVAADVHQLHHRLADAFQQSLDGIRLHAMDSKLADDLLLVFGKDGRNVAHAVSIEGGRKFPLPAFPAEFGRRSQLAIGPETAIRIVNLIEADKVFIIISEYL